MKNIIAEGIVKKKKDKMHCSFRVNNAEYLSNVLDETSNEFVQWIPFDKFQRVCHNCIRSASK